MKLTKYYFNGFDTSNDYRQLNVKEFQKPANPNLIRVLFVDANAGIAIYYFIEEYVGRTFTVFAFSRSFKKPEPRVNRIVLKNVSRICSTKICTNKNTVSINFDR